MKIVQFRLLFSLALVVSVLAGWAVGTSRIEVIHGTDQFEFTYRVKLPEISQAARLWLPLARSDAYQTVKVERVTSPLAYREVKDRDHGNQILVLAPTPRDSGKVIEIKYAVQRREKDAYPATEKDVLRYLQPERLVPRNETFVSLATKETQAAKGDLARGRALYQHVLDRMKYDKSGAGWGRGDALYACDARTGNCTDFHAYFVALARAADIPARFAIGYTIPADSDEGKIAGYHCWAEFYAEGKWVPVDISEASKSLALAGYYFGHHPANRFEFTQGRDLVVNPAPTSSPINFLIYPLLEVGGQVVKTENEFSFKRMKVN